MMQRLGPYTDEKTLRNVVRTFNNMGESVRIEETWCPYEKKGRKYEGYVIREATA